jgi:ribosomal protein S18 acetylase RimI-like enzyme
MGLPDTCDIPSRAHDVEIRLASEADLDALVRLAVAFRDHFGFLTPVEADLRASIAHLLQDAATEFFLACNTCGMPLGYVQARYRYSAWTTALEAELEDVFVIREARRNGVGLHLVEFAVTRAIAQGCRTIGLNTNERNAGAAALYQRLGFEAERALWQGGRQLWLTKSLSTG